MENKNQPKTSLALFAALPKQQRGGFDLKKAKRFVEIMQRTIQPGIAVDYEKIAKDMKKSFSEMKLVASGAKNFAIELKKANEDKYTLESYFAAGRPCKYGTQLANKKKNEPKK